MSVVQTIKYVQEMVDYEAIYSNKDTAVSSLARRLKTTKDPLLYLYRGKAKTVISDLKERVDREYLKFCERQIQRFERELREIEKPDDFMENLSGQMAALAAEIKKRRERIK